MTTQTIPKNLYEEFQNLLEKGDEQAARIFLTDNFTKFPEHVQEEITMAFFEEAVLEKAADIKNIASLQKEGTEAYSQLAKEKKELEDQAKVHDIKKDLGV